MQNIVFAVLMTGSIALTGCNLKTLPGAILARDAFVEREEKRYRQMLSVTLCNVVRNEENASYKLEAAAKVLRSRGEDCK